MSYTMGEHTLRIPKTLFGINRERLVHYLRKKKLPRRTAVVLKGAAYPRNNYPDTSQPFKQESFFFWAFGIIEPNCIGVIEVANARSILFVPERSMNYMIWNGTQPSLDELKTLWDVDEVYNIREIIDILKESLLKPLLILRNPRLNSHYELGAHFEGIDRFEVDFDVLYPAMLELRLTKSSIELLVMKYVCKITSEAVLLAMQKIQPGMFEYQIKAIFEQYVLYVGGCECSVQYNTVASGKNSSILKYGCLGPSCNKVIEEGDMVVIDVGACYFGYNASIAVSLPANGKFSLCQKLLIECIEKVNNNVMSAVKPGVLLNDLQEIGERNLLEELVKINILCGEIDRMMTMNLASIFLPHRISLLLGLDTDGLKDYGESCVMKEENVLTHLVLSEGMILTVATGCYFIEALLEQAKLDPYQSKFFTADLNRFSSIGGVRLKQNIIVTVSGYDILSDIPTNHCSIERVIASGKKQFVDLSQELARAYLLLE